MAEKTRRVRGGTDKIRLREGTEMLTKENSYSENKGGEKDKKSSWL